MTEKQKGWVKALVAAFISGSAQCLVGAAIVPGHLKAVGVLAVISGAKVAAAYLVKSPLPNEEK